MITSFVASASRRLLASQRRIFVSPTPESFSRRFSFSANDSGITIDGASFPYRWLRDSCQCPSCVHPSTNQKLRRTSDVNLDIKPISDGIRPTDEGIYVEWTTGHKSFYAATFLEHHSSPSKLFEAHKDVPRISWDASSISKTPDLFLPYTSLQTSRGLLTAINQLSQLGLLFITGVPNTESSNDTCELRTLAQFFGDLRKTFYGELWDVKNVRNSRNIAYTNLDLGLHMDLLYFEHPPRYQILHCLRNRVLGGTSIFVDAVHAAALLYNTNPEAFDVLATTPVAFHYINDGHHLHHSHPTIELATALPSFAKAPWEQSIDHINYSPPFQAPLSLFTTPAFYPALAEFASLLAKPDLTFTYTLKEGDAVLFDNRRVLHARTAFTDKGDGNAGNTNRWLKGCYLETDALLDRGRVLRTKAEQGLL